MARLECKLSWQVLVFARLEYQNCNCIGSAFKASARNSLRPILRRLLYQRQQFSQGRVAACLWQWSEQYFLRLMAHPGNAQAAETGGGLYEFCRAMGSHGSDGYHLSAMDHRGFDFGVPAVLASTFGATQIGSNAIGQCKSQEAQRPPEAMSD